MTSVPLSTPRSGAESATVFRTLEGKEDARRKQSAPFLLPSPVTSRTHPLDTSITQASILSRPLAGEVWNLPLEEFLEHLRAKVELGGVLIRPNSERHSVVSAL